VNRLEPGSAKLAQDIIGGSPVPGASGATFTDLRAKLEPMVANAFV
jgi:hypothetical protein